MQTSKGNFPAQVVPPTLELCENGLVRMAPEGWVRLILYRSPFSGERHELVAPAGTSLRELIEDAVGRPLDPERDTLNIIIGDRTVLFDEVASYKLASGECVIARIVPGITGTSLLITSLVLTTVSLALSVAGMVTGNPILGYIGMGVGVLAIAAGGLAAIGPGAGAALGPSVAATGVVGTNLVGSGSILASVTVGQAASMISLGGGLAQGIVGMVGALTQGQAGIPAQKGVENSAYLKGVGNRAAQWQPIPSVFGRTLFAPPLGGQQVGEVAADGRMWVSATFVAGYGPVEIKAEDIQIGETLLSNYEADTYELEVREGFQDDTNTTLYPSGVSVQEVSAVLIKAEQVYGSFRAAEADHPTLTGRIRDSADAGDTTVDLFMNDNVVLGTQFTSTAGTGISNPDVTSWFWGRDNLILPNGSSYGPSTQGNVTEDIGVAATTITVGNPGGDGYAVGDPITIRSGTRQKFGGRYYWHTTTVDSIAGDVLTLETPIPSNHPVTEARVGAVFSDFSWDLPSNPEDMISDGDTLCVQLDDYSWQEVTVAAGGVGALSTEHWANVRYSPGQAAFTAAPYRTITFSPPLERRVKFKAGVIRFGSLWETRTTAPDTVEATIELHNPTGIVSIDDSGDRHPRTNELCVWIRSSDPGGPQSPGPGRWQCVSSAGDGKGSAVGAYMLDLDSAPLRTQSENWGVVPSMSRYPESSIDWNAVNGSIGPGIASTHHPATHYGIFGLATEKLLIWGGERFRGTFASFSINSLDEGQYDIRLAVSNVTWNQKLGRGDTNWTGLQSKSKAPTSQTAVKMAQVALRLKSTDERSGTIGDLKVLGHRMLPFYEKNPAVSNGGDWIEPPSRTARTQVKTSIDQSSTLVCELSEKVELSADASRGDINVSLDSVGMLREGDEISFSDGDSTVVYSEDFASTDGGWRSQNSTHSSASGALQVVATGNDPYQFTDFIRGDLGRTIRGSDFTQVKVWIKKGTITGSGIWEGNIRWKSSVDNQYFGQSEYFDGPQVLSVAEPTWTGGYVEVTWDMANAPYDVRPGGTPSSTWLDREIWEIRFDFFKLTDVGNDYDIDKIEISGAPKYEIKKVDKYESEITLARRLYTDIPGTAYCGTWIEDVTGATSSAGDRGARQIGRDPKDDSVTMPHYITVGTTSEEPEIDLPFRNDLHSFSIQDEYTLESDHLHVEMNLAGSDPGPYPQIWAVPGVNTYTSVPSRDLTHASFSVRCPRPMDSPGGGFFALFYCYDDTTSNATNFAAQYLISGSTDDINDTTFTELTFFLSPAVGNVHNWGVGNLSSIVIRPVVLTDGADWEDWGWFDVKDFKMWKAAAPAKVLSSVFTANTATYTLEDPITVTAGDAVAVDYEKFLTRSPAWACAEVLRGNAQPRRVTESFIDSDSISDWNDYCLDPAGDGSQPKFQFDTLVDFRGTTLELINRISGSARGSLRASDGRLGFLWDFDRSAETPVAMFTPRNSQKLSYKSAFSYVDLPHAWRVRYNDEEGNAGEHLVFRDGYNKYGSSGATKATRYEVLQTWGITDPDAVFQYAKYTLANATYRREVVSIGVDIEHAMVERGDLVILSHDTDFSGLSFGRIAMLNSGDVKDFSGVGVLGAIDEQDGQGSASSVYEILDGGKTIRLSENTWKYDTRSMTIPSGARLQFDFRGENYEPELCKIGFTDATFVWTAGPSWNLWGTQSSARVEPDYDDHVTMNGSEVSAGNWVSYEIDLDGYDDGTTTRYLFFGHDNDTLGAAQSAATYFRNVRITTSITSVELDEPITLTNGETGYKAKIRQAGTQSFVEYDLTNTNTSGDSGNEKQTETMTFETPPSLAAGPDVGDMVVFGQGQVVPRRMLVEGVTPSSNLGAGIQLVDEGEGIWPAVASSATTIPAPEPIQNYFSDQMRPKKPRIDSISIKKNQSGVEELAVSVSPSHHDTVPLGHFEIEWQVADNEGWSAADSHIAMASTGPREVRFPFTEPMGVIETGTYPKPIQVRARSHRQGATHYHSDWVKTEKLTTTSLRSAGLIDYVVIALELSGQGNNYEFYSAYPRIEWKIGQIPEVHNELLYGDHGDINTDWWSQGPNTHYPVGIPTVSVPCEVVVSHAPDGVASKVLRVENIAEASYVYSLDKNLADGGPYRDLKFTVTPATGVERGSSQTIFVTNPAHPLPLVKSISQDQLSVIFDFDDNFRQEADLANLIVWASTTSGFTPGDSNQIYSGRFSKRLRLPSMEPVTWYFRWAVTDTFYRDSDGTSGLNLSEEKTLRMVPAAESGSILVGEAGNFWPDPVFNYAGDFQDTVDLEHFMQIVETSSTNTSPIFAIREAEGVPTISPRGGKYMLCLDAAGLNDHTSGTAGSFAFECPRFEEGWSAIHESLGSLTLSFPVIPEESQLQPAAPGDVISFGFYANRSANSDSDRAGIDYPSPAVPTSGAEAYLSLHVRFWDKDGKPLNEDGSQTTSGFPLYWTYWLPWAANVWYGKADFPKNTWTHFQIERVAPANACKCSALVTIGGEYVTALFGSQSSGAASDPGQIYFDSFDFRRASEAKHLAASAVTTAKLADSTGSSDGVTTAKLAANAVTTRSQDALTASRSVVFGAHDIGTASMLWLYRKISEITVDAGSEGGIAKCEWTGTTARTTSGNCKPTFRIAERGVTTTQAQSSSLTTKIYFYVDSADGFEVGDLVGIDVDSGDASGGAGQGTTATDGGGSVFVIRELDLVTNTTVPDVKLLRVSVPIYWNTAAGGEIFQIISDIVPRTSGETYDSASYPVDQMFQLSATDATPRTGSRTFVFLLGNTATSLFHYSRMNDGSAATVEIVKK